MRGNAHSISSIQKHLQARHSVKDINNDVNKSVALSDISFRHPVFARLQLTDLGRFTRMYSQHIYRCAKQ